MSRQGACLLLAPLAASTGSPRGGGGGGGVGVSKTVRATGGSSTGIVACLSNELLGRGRGAIEEGCDDCKKTNEVGERREERERERERG